MIQQQAPAQNPAGNQSEPSQQHTDPMSQYTQLIASNPGLSVTLGFGLGFGAGVVLASLLGDSRSSLSRYESMAERIGHQVAKSVREALPSWKNPLRS